MTYRGLFAVFAIIGLLALQSIAFQAFAFSPQSIFDWEGNRLPDSEANSSRVAWEILSIKNHPEWGAMGLLSQSSFQGGCSATYIDVGGSERSPAYIITNGHCLMNQMPGPDEYWVDIAPARGLHFTARYFVDASNNRVSLSVERVEYATMTGTDLALMRLRSRVGELTSLGIKGFPLSADLPQVGEQVANVGIPQDRIRFRYLRKSECQILGFVDLIEGAWSFKGSMRNQCSVLGGSSGSALVSLRTKKIVALINTGVDDNIRVPCFENHPCEVDSHGNKSSHPEFNYAQKIQGLTSCFDDEGVFRLESRGCALVH